MLFGYTNPDILDRLQNETPSDGTHMFNGSWVQRMENFKEIKEMIGEYPRVNIQAMPEKLNDFTINSISANFKPEAGLFSNLYNGLSNDEKTYSYRQQVYIPPSYTNHFYNTNTFSALYIAEMKRQDKTDEFEF
jgi:hypothetical protein